MRRAPTFAPLGSALVAAMLLAPVVAHGQPAAPATQPTPPAAGKPAAAQPEEDDPAFSRPTKPPAKPKPTPATPPPEEDPFPQPLPPEEEDPGFVPAPAATRGLSLRRRAPPEPRGMRLRASYRTWSLGEGSMDMAGREDRFHALGVDIYPISGPVRVGLGAQVARETTDGDTFGTVSLAAGIQRPGRPWTAYGEVQVQAGMGERTFCTNFTDVFGCKDLLTALWGFGIEGGVDGRLFGRTFGTVAIGFQHNQYFSVEVQQVQGELNVFTDNTFTIKLGIGY